MNKIIFLVEEIPEGGYTTRAPGESIFTEADTITHLRDEVSDSVKCHFDSDTEPKINQLNYSNSH